MQFNAKKKVFNDAFYEKGGDKLLFELPNHNNIANYAKNIIITSKMEKEVIIICLVYIERLIVCSGFYLLPENWRRITFVALVLASKVFFLKNEI